MDNGKGVVCKLAEPWEMPVAANGVRADLVMSPDSVAGRMNLGVLYEIYVNGSSHEEWLRLRKMLDVQETESDREIEQRLTTMESSGDSAFEAAWESLMGFFRILTPMQAGMFEQNEYSTPDSTYRKSRAHYLSKCLTHPSKHIVLFLPPENPIYWPTAVKELEKHYPQTYGPVQYHGYSPDGTPGELITTRRPVRIARSSIILLEKTGDDWAAVSSGKLQHFGVLGQATNSDKYATPTRTNSIRAKGESEVRLDISNVGPRATAETLDRSNSPATHKFMLHTVLNATHPTHIHEAVDRDVVPLGGSKPIQFIKHLLMCGGIEFAYKSSDSPYAK